MGSHHFLSNPTKNISSVTETSFYQNHKSRQTVPNLFVDCIQLLLKHHGQSLSISLTAGWQEVNRTEYGLPVILNIWHVNVAFKRLGHVGQHACLLGSLPVLLVQSLNLQELRDIWKKFQTPMGKAWHFYCFSKMFKVIFKQLTYMLNASIKMATFREM